MWPETNVVLNYLFLSKNCFFNHKNINKGLKWDLCIWFLWLTCRRLIIIYKHNILSGLNWNNQWKNNVLQILNFTKITRRRKKNILLKMETCVLIPQEFSLVVTSLGARNSGEQVASVWTTNRIKQGAFYYPFQGTVRIDKLNVYSYVDEEDVSTDQFFASFYFPFNQTAKQINFNNNKKNDTIFTHLTIN